MSHSVYVGVTVLFAFVLSHCQGTRAEGRQIGVSRLACGRGHPQKDARRTPTRGPAARSFIPTPHVLPPGYSLFIYIYIYVYVYIYIYICIYIYREREIHIYIHAYMYIYIYIYITIFNSLVETVFSVLSATGGSPEVEGGDKLFGLLEVVKQNSATGHRDDLPWYTYTYTCIYIYIYIYIYTANGAKPGARRPGLGAAVRLGVTGVDIILYYVYMYIYVYIHTHILIHIHVRVHTHIHIHIHQCMNVYMYVCMHV